MNGYLQDQADEIEALKAIYSNEYEDIAIVPPYQFKIHLQPSADDAENHVAIALIFELPESYPGEDIPTISVELKKGLGNKHKDEIVELAKRNGTDSLGAPSVYTISEAVREWLIDNNAPGQDGSMYAEMMRRMQQKDVDKKKKDTKAAIAAAADHEILASKDALDPEEEERIRKRQAGVQVTLESFLSWKEKFDAEMALVKHGYEWEELPADILAKPTGKQLFLANAAGLEEALIAVEEQEEAAAHIAEAMAAASRRAKQQGGDGGAEGEGGNVEIKEDLFMMEDDDLDLEDFSDDEDYEDDGEEDDDDYEDDA